MFCNRTKDKHQVQNNWKYKDKYYTVQYRVGIPNLFCQLRNELPEAPLKILSDQKEA